MNKAQITEPGKSWGMDLFTRNYLIVPGLSVAAILGAWIASWNPRVVEINDLSAD